MIKIQKGGISVFFIQMEMNDLNINYDPLTKIEDKQISYIEKRKNSNDEFIMKSMKTSNIEKKNLMYCIEMMLLLKSNNCDLIPTINSISYEKDELKVEELKLKCNVNDYMKERKRNKEIHIFIEMINKLSEYDVYGIIDKISFKKCNILLNNKGNIYLDDFYKNCIKNEDEIEIYITMNLITKLKILFNSMIILSKTSNKDKENKNKDFINFLNNLADSTTIEELQLIFEDTEKVSYLKSKIKHFEYFYFHKINTVSNYICIII